MGVVSVNELTDRESTSSLAGLTNRRTCRRAYRVVMDSASEGAYQARFASDGSTSVPRVGEAHPDDWSLHCNNVTSRAIDDTAVVFDVFCDYAGEFTWQGDESDTQTSPLEMPAVMRWGSVSAYRPMFIDKTPTPDDDPPGSGPWHITSSADEPYDPPVEVPVSHLTLSITKNVTYASLSAVDLMEYIDTVNSMIWKGAPAKTVRMSRFSANQGYYAPTELYYWQVTYDFDYLKAPIYDKNLPIPQTVEYGWQSLGLLLDQGTIKKTFKDPDYVYEKILDDNGVPIGEPVLLDGYGQMLPPEEHMQPVYSAFQLFKEKDFNELDL